MAGAGYKLFNTGDVLTAAQVNTYLQEQAVMRFASAAARTTALSGVLAEGMVSYLMDTNAVEVYDGSAWVGVASGDITAVTAGTGISGGGTSGAVTITNSMATEITAAGDIIVGTGSGTFDNLPIGTTGQILTADTTVSPYKVKWATAASGGSMTELASQTFSNTASHTFSSISGSYQFLFLKLVGVRSTTNEQPIRLRFNSDTGTNYKQGAWTDLGKDSPLNTGITVLRDPDQGSTACLGSVWIYNYASTGRKAISSLEASKSLLVYGQIGGWNSSDAITSITIYAASGNLEGGTATLYGGN